MVTGFTTLAGYEYIALTTFSSGGESVTTRAWFAQTEGSLYVISDADEVQRIHHNAQVEVAACTERGDLLGAPLEAMALVLPDDQTAVARRALTRKYGLRQRLREVEQAIQRAQTVYLEVTPM